MAIEASTTAPAGSAPALKRFDAWWTVLVIDQIALLMLPGLIRRKWITPTGVTLASLVPGVGAVVALAAHQFVVGALLFEAKFLLDCLDGKLARARRQVSLRGKLIDQMIDVPITGACVGLVAIQGGQTPAALAALIVGLVVLEAWSRGLLSSVESAVPPLPAADSGVSGGWSVRAAFHRRRLAVTPTTVDMETLLVAASPVLVATGAVRPVVVAAVVFYALVLGRNLRAALKLASAATR